MSSGFPLLRYVAALFVQLVEGELVPEESMATVYKAAYVSLHVRKSNRAALGLYRDTLGFTVRDIEKGYCEFSCRTAYVG